MYNHDNRTVITLDAGGTNFVFGAMLANEFIIDPITLPSLADNLDECLAQLIKGFEKVIKKYKLSQSPSHSPFPVPRTMQME